MSLETSLLGALGSMGPAPPRCALGAARTSDAKPSRPPEAPSGPFRVLRLAGRPEELAPYVARPCRWPWGLSVLSWRLLKKGNQLLVSESLWLGESSATRELDEPAGPDSSRYACTARALLILPFDVLIP